MRNATDLAWQQQLEQDKLNSLRNIKRGRAEKLGPLKNPENTMMTVIHLCLFVCMFVSVCLCVCLYEMVTFDDGGGGSQRRQVPPARAAAAVRLFKN